MHAATTDRAKVLEVIQRALAELEGGAAGAELEGTSPQRLAEMLREGRGWMLEEEPKLAGETDDLGPGAQYISRHTVVALVQSAMEEAAEEQPGALAAAPRVPLGLIARNVRLADRDSAEFREHQSLDDFRFPLAEECTVALVGDWGTGSRGARKVARAIKRARPDHVIHLGDIYPAGKHEQVEKNFLRVWREHGPDPAQTKFWALNGNHEMKSGGHAYFEVVIDRFCRDQTASYFSLENEHWKLIGLDTAYVDHDLHAAQKPWLMARLKDGGARSILLTHHQPFSAVDSRPGNHGLFNTMQDFIATERIFGWFWGHEHGLLIYDREPVFGGFCGRAIGHGGKDIRNPYFVDEVHPSPRVRHGMDVTRADDPRFLANGFALLRFKGPRVEVSYPDETGETEWHPEIWPDHPHGP